MSSNKLSWLLRLVLFAALLLVGGCVVITSNVSQSEKLGKDEGFLLTTIHTARPEGQLSLHREIGSPYATFELTRSPELRLIRIKAADQIRVSTYTVGNVRYYWDDTAYTFTVKPGSINYIGDIEMVADGRRTAVRIVDNEVETLAQAKTSYGWLFDKYPYVKATPLKSEVNFLGVRP